MNLKVVLVVVSTSGDIFGIDGENCVLEEQTVCATCKQSCLVFRMKRGSP